MQYDLTYKYIGQPADCLKEKEFEYIGNFAYNLKTYIKGNYTVFTQFNSQTEREEIYRVILEGGKSD